MKILRLFLLIASCSLIFDAAAMKRKEIEREEASPATSSESSSWESTEPKRAKFDFAALERLPRDLKILQLIAIIDTSTNINEAIKTIHSLAKTSKVFYQLINSDDVNKQLITLLADRFLHGDCIEVAERLHTTASLLWSSTTIPEAVRKHVWKIMRDYYGLKKLFTRMSQYIHSSENLKRIFNNECAQIWLLKIISKMSSDLIVPHIRPIAPFARIIYPEGILYKKVQDWITYADNQLKYTDEIQNALESDDFEEELAALQAKGVDITDYPFYFDSEPFLFNVENSEVLPLLFNAGADINERGEGIRDKGITFLHHLINQLKTAGNKNNIDWLQNIRDSIRVLLELGANPNIRDNRDQTALGLAKHVLYKAEKEAKENEEEKLNGRLEEKVAILREISQIIEAHGGREGDWGVLEEPENESDDSGE